MSKEINLFFVNFLIFLTTVGVTGGIGIDLKNWVKKKDSDGNIKGAIVQAEDELSAIGMAIGANWNGARSFTATSGPGVSLMSEFLGLAYFAEIPLVLFNIQRGGPSTGMPTRTQQSDIISSAYASHGDTKQILLFPSDPKECFEMSIEAFDIAERLQTPVIFMSDLDIGMNDWVVDELELEDTHKFDRGKVLSAKDLDAIEMWGRYLDIDGDGILELLISHGESGAQPLSLFKANVSNTNYIRIKPLNTFGAPARGATVTLHTNLRNHAKTIDAGSGYLCQMEPVAHYGLREGEIIKNITIKWTNGTIDSYEINDINNTFEFKQGI